MLAEKGMKIKTGPLIKTDAVRNAPPIETIKGKAIKRTIDTLNDSFRAGQAASGDNRASTKKTVSDVLSVILSEEGIFISRADRERIIEEVTYEITGFGPIEPFLQDPEVFEIMVNGPKQVYIEKGGRIIKSGVAFRDDEHVRHTIEKIISPLGRRLDDTSPMVDARLPDGSRINAIIPPLALNGPTLTIRKFTEAPYTVEQLIQFGTLTAEMAVFLKACVESRINIVISGGTGSGKTTTLNVLSSFIPEYERIITIEDAAELRLGQEHVVSLETRPPNIEGKGTVTVRDLVINSLRMRPDRIVVGEVRGGEALDMLQAMNTGHDGSITTGHANSPRDILLRIETMVLMAGVNLPLRAIREQIATAITLIVHQERLRDGSRKIVNISEITGIEGDSIILQDIFVFQHRGVDSEGCPTGCHIPTGIVPKLIERIDPAGTKELQKILRCS